MTQAPKQAPNTVPPALEADEQPTAFSLLSARPDDPPNIRSLRLVVISMGILMALGFGAVIARIVYLTTRPAPVLQSAAPAPTAAPAAAGLPATGRIPVPAGAKVLSHSWLGDRVSVHYALGSEEFILVIDPQTGETVSRLTIVPASK